MRGGRGESEQEAGLIRPVSANGFALCGRSLSLAEANQRPSRAKRIGLFLRVPDTRELEQLLCAGRQRAGAFPSLKKPGTLTFSVDYKKTGKAAQQRGQPKPAPRELNQHLRYERL